MYCSRPPAGQRSTSQCPLPWLSSRATGLQAAPVRNTECWAWRGGYRPKGSSGRLHGPGRQEQPSLGISDQTEGQASPLEDGGEEEMKRRAQPQ